MSKKNPIKAAFTNLEGEHLLCLLEDAIVHLQQEIAALPKSIQKMTVKELEAKGKDVNKEHPKLSQRQQDINLCDVNRNYIAHYEQIIRKLGYGPMHK